MNHFRELRLSHNMSQKDLAEKLGINQTAVSQWERGVTAPSSNLLAELCKVLGTTSDYLLGIVDDLENNYIWQDSEIMNEIKNGFPSHLKNLLAVMNDCSDHDQKMTFDILVELRHILLLKDENVKAAALELLQGAFSISTHFVDSCIRTTQDCEEERLLKLKQSCIENYSTALTTTQKTII